MTKLPVNTGSIEGLNSKNQPLQIIDDQVHMRLEGTPLETVKMPILGPHHPLLGDPQEDPEALHLIQVVTPIDLGLLQMEGKVVHLFFIGVGLEITIGAFQPLEFPKGPLQGHLDLEIGQTPAPVNTLIPPNQPLEAEVLKHAVYVAVVTQHLRPQMAKNVPFMVMFCQLGPHVLIVKNITIRGTYVCMDPLSDPQIGQNPLKMTLNQRHQKTTK